MNGGLEDSKYWYEKGIKYYNQKSFLIAIRCFDRYLNFNSDKGFDAWYMKGNSFYQLHEYSKAAYCFNKSICN